METSKPINILAFSNGTGSVQWRLEAPANYINTRTESAMFVTNSDEWNEDTIGADIIVAQMWRNPKGIDVAHRQGAKVVYEADDIIMGVGGKERKNLMDLTPEQEEMTKETISKADLVTVTTDVLAEHYKKFNDNVIVLPNYMDFMWWGKPWKAKPYKELRLGWMGSKSHREDLLMIEPIVERVLEEFDFVKWVYCGFGGKRNLYGEELFKNIPPHRKEYYIGVPLEFWPQKSKSLGFDIGLAPLVDDEFNAGKSAIKYYEYGANGVPGVYSDTIVYRDSVKHGKTGFLAKTDEQYYRYIEKLILSDQVRYQIAEASYNDILDNYNMEDHYNDWLEAYRSIL